MTLDTRPGLLLSGYVPLAVVKTVKNARRGDEAPERDSMPHVTKIPDLPARGHLATLRRLREAGWLGISASPRGLS